MEGEVKTHIFHTRGRPRHSGSQECGKPDTAPSRPSNHLPGTAKVKVGFGNDVLACSTPADTGPDPGGTLSTGVAAAAARTYPRRRTPDLTCQCPTEYGNLEGVSGKTQTTLNSRLNCLGLKTCPQIAELWRMRRGGRRRRNCTETDADVFGTRKLEGLTSLTNGALGDLEITGSNLHPPSPQRRRRREFEVAPKRCAVEKVDIKLAELSGVTTGSMKACTTHCACATGSEVTGGACYDLQHQKRSKTGGHLTEGHYQGRVSTWRQMWASTMGICAWRGHGTIRAESGDCPLAVNGECDTSDCMSSKLTNSSWCHHGNNMCRRHHSNRTTRALSESCPTCLDFTYGNDVAASSGDNRKYLYRDKSNMNGAKTTVKSQRQRTIKSTLDLVWLGLISLSLMFLTVAPPVGAQTGVALRYTIREELPPYTYVGNIARDIGLIVTQGMELELQNPATPIEGPYFTLNKTTGILRTARSIDREKVCNELIDSEPCTIKFTVLQHRPFFHVIKVEVSLQDYNDHSPEFPDGRIARTISETTKPDTTFSIPAAEDFDGGINSVQDYELIAATNKFALQFTNDSGFIHDLNLVLKAPLDRETEKAYSLVITAKDGGNPPRTGSMIIDITVGDANDNNPKFDNETYELTIPEDVAQHTKILQLHAHDPDMGLNGDLIYGLSQGTQDKLGHLFMVNAISGGLYVKGDLDYEQGDTYILTVTARDQGPNSLPAYAKVIIHVGDVNDHAPHITINSLDSRELGAGDSAFIKEHLAAGTFVAHVSVSDPDAGTSGHISCTMHSAYFELKPTARTSYQIISRKEFDREEQEEYHLSLSCTDHGDPQLTSVKDITVKVIDVNDHGPRFTKRVYSVNMEENNHVDAIVVQVNATDKDTGRNAAIKYMLKDEDLDGEFVMVEPITGIVRAQVSFDYEEMDRYSFTIIAVDQGNDPHTATTTLIINVKDVNDGRPTFTRPAYSFKIFENMPAHIKVGLLSASDADGPPYNDIIYSLSKASEGLDAFAINSDNGELTTRKELDREKHEVYHLYAVASNRGYNNVNSTVNITITVVDQNDNGPVFIFPTTWNNTVHVPDNVAIGETIGKAEAKDADTGTNGQLVYSLLKGNDTFAIEHRTGVIKVTEELKCLSSRTCKMVILVKDSGTPQRTRRAELSVMPKSAAAYERSLEAMFFFSGTNIIIIIAASVISILLIVLILVVFCRRRRRHQDKKREREMDAKIASVTDSTDGEISIKSLKNGKLPNGCYDGATMMKPKKEVKFIVDTVGMGESSTDDLSVSWPSKLDTTMIEDPGSRSTSLGSPANAPTSHHNAALQRAPHQPNHPTTHTPTAPSTNDNLSTPWVPRHGVVNPQVAATPPLKRSSPIAPLTEMEIEMAEVLQMLSREQQQQQQQQHHLQHHQQQQQQQDNSETGSITDSGRGPSEEGDNTRPSPLDPQINPEDQKGCRSGVDGRGRPLQDNSGASQTSDLLRSKSSELFASFKRPDSAGSSSTKSSLKSSLSTKSRLAGSQIPPPPPPPSLSSTYASMIKRSSVSPMEAIPRDGVIHGGMSSFRPSSHSSNSSSSSSWLSGGHAYQRSTDSSGSGSSTGGPLSKFRFQSKKPGGAGGTGGGGGATGGVGGGVADPRREPPYQTVLAMSGRSRTSPHHEGKLMAETNLDDPSGTTVLVDSNGNRENKRTVNFNLSHTATFPRSHHNNNSTDGGGAGVGGGGGGGGVSGGSLKRRTLEYNQRPSSGYSSGSDSRLYKDPRPPDPPLIVYDTSPSERHLQQMEMTCLGTSSTPLGLHGRPLPHQAVTGARRIWGRDDALSDDSTTTSGSYVLNATDVVEGQHHAHHHQHPMGGVVVPAGVNNITTSGGRDSAQQPQHNPQHPQHQQQQQQQQQRSGSSKHCVV